MRRSEYKAGGRGALVGRTKSINVLSLCVCSPPPLFKGSEAHLFKRLEAEKSRRENDVAV